MLEVSGSGFNQVLSSKEGNKCRHPPCPETLGWLRGGLLTSRTEDLRAHLRAGLGFRWLYYI